VNPPGHRGKDGLRYWIRSYLPEDYCATLKTSRGRLSKDNGVLVYVYPGGGLDGLEDIIAVMRMGAVAAARWEKVVSDVLRMNLLSIYTEQIL